MKHLQTSLRLITVLMITVAIPSLIVLSSFYSPYPPETQPDFRIPVITGIKQLSGRCLTPAYMLNAWYDLECVEPFCEVFDLEKKHKKINWHEFYDNSATKEPASFSNSGLVVIADTINELSMKKTPIWASYLFHHNLGSSRSLRQDDTLVQEVKSFPIYIANLSKTQTATLGTQDGSVIMVLEAMDQDREWKPIEYWSHSWCGNSYFSTTLPPEHFAFTRGIKCSGDFTTSCRLKLSNKGDTLYSNIFRMSISRSQFRKAPGAER
jgi:hypothetical protein